MPEERYPRITEADMKKAQNDRAKSVGLAASVVGTIVTVQSALNSPGGPLVRGLLQSFTGVKVTPTPGPLGAGRVSFPKAGIIGALLPAPVGYVPAEHYGLHPDVVKQSLGFRVGQKPPFLNASAARIKTFEAGQVAEAILRRATQNPSGRDPAGGGSRFQIPSGPINVTRFELDYLKSLPTGFHRAQIIIAELERRADDLLGSTTPRPGGVLDSAEAHYVNESRRPPTPLTVAGHLRHLVAPIAGSTEAIETAAGQLLPIGAGGFVIG